MRIYIYIYIYITEGGVADEELAEPLVQSEEGGDVAAEETELLLQSEGDAEEVMQLPPLVRAEGDDDSIVITTAEAWIGPEFDLDDVSVTTGCTVSTRLLADSHFAPWCGPDASTLPEIGLYHPEQYQPAIQSEIRNDYGLVLNPPPLRL